MCSDRLRDAGTCLSVRLHLWYFAILTTCTFAKEKDYTPLIKKAVERSKLNQPGTKPSHLKAEIGAQPGVRDSGRTDEVEIAASETVGKRLRFQRSREIFRSSTVYPNVKVVAVSMLFDAIHASLSIVHMWNFGVGVN